MDIQYILINPGEEPVLKQEPLPYERLVEIIGGSVEAKNILRGQACLYMCEEGKQRALAYNHLATTLVRGLIHVTDFVVGPVVVVGPPDERGRDGSVTDEVWKYVQTVAQKEMV